MNKHINKDSLKHFGINFVCAVVGGTLGIGVGLGASITKEYCDKLYYGHFCKTDLGADALGLILGALVNRVTQYAIFKELVY